MTEIRENEKYPIFTKLKFDEVTYTQLLCNLMIRCGRFQDEMLELLTKGDCKVGKITSENITTQKHLSGDGFADILIKTIDLILILEVKLKDYCATTPNQVDGRYADYLRKDPSNRHKWLVYLVPNKWIHREAIEKGLETIEKNGIVKTCLVTWEDVCWAIQSRSCHTCDPLVHEFGNFLKPKFGPISFTEEETNLMFAQNFATTFKAVRKLEMLVDALAKKLTNECKKRNKDIAENDNRFDVSPRDSESEYGVYLVRRKNLPTEKPLLWIGIWDAVNAQISFGIEKAWEQETPGLLAALGATKEIRFEGSSDVWSLQMVSQDALKNRAPSVDEVWDTLKPALEGVFKASEKQKL